MPFKSRLMIGLNGHQPDIHLLRYASMVVRLRSGPTHDGLDVLAPDVSTAAASAAGNEISDSSPSPPDAGETEIRFVYLCPRTKGSQPPRGALRAQVQKYFTGLSERVVIGFDLLKGHALQRLAAFSADFDSDLLLVSDAGWPRWKCARLAMEAPCSVWLVPPAWAPVLRRVLVPVDFSERSARCLRLACELMRHAPQAKCLALHVYRCEGRFDNPAVRQSLAARLESFIAETNAGGVAVAPVLVESQRVERAIARAAHDHRADLIVMSSPGRSRIAALVHTGVAERTIRETRTSFLVMKCSGPPVGFWRALGSRLRDNQDPQFS